MDEASVEGPVPAGFAILPVELVPHAHNPFKCDAFREWRQDHPGWRADDGTTAFHAWLDDDPDRATRCSWHAEADSWLLGSRLAVEVLRQLDGATGWAVGPTGGVEASPLDAIEALIADHDEIDNDALWKADTFLSEPIMWAPGSSELSNGQHRSCVLRHADAEEVPVYVR